MFSFLVFLRSERYSSVGYRWISSHGSSISCSDHLRYVCVFQVDGLLLFLAEFFFLSLSPSIVIFPAVNGISINGDEMNGNGNSNHELQVSVLLKPKLNHILVHRKLISVRLPTCSREKNKIKNKIKKSHSS